MTGFIIFLAVYLLITFSGWRIFKRAGFHGAYGLLFLLPALNLVALIYLAYRDWPVVKNK
jgi:hypothetical protein